MTPTNLTLYRASVATLFSVKELDSGLPWRQISLIFCLSFWLLATAMAATEEMLEFDSDEQRVLFKALTHEYRCLKCQNQTIASSNADLAGDLRREIHQLVRAGKTRAEIDTYLLDRYGDFVLYKPRLKLSTLLLWLGPFGLLLLALWFAIRTASEKSRSNLTLDPAHIEQARAALKKNK